MTQVKCRTAGGKGMSQAAWKYAMMCENGKRNKRDGIKRKEDEARKNITLPKLKWMEKAEL